MISHRGDDRPSAAEFRGRSHEGIEPGLGGPALGLRSTAGIERRLQPLDAIALDRNDVEAAWRRRRIGAQEVLRHVARLWGFGVHLESVNARGDVTKRWSVQQPSD